MVGRYHALKTKQRVEAALSLTFQAGSVKTDCLIETFNEGAKLTLVGVKTVLWVYIPRA